MTNKLLLKTAAWAGLWLALTTAQAQHGHLNAGALGTNPGDALNFANGAILAASSGYLETLSYTNDGAYAGYFEGGITLTALPTTIANGGPVACAPAPGPFIHAPIESVTGLASGSFGFCGEGAASPTFSYKAGSATPSGLFALGDRSTGAAIHPPSETPSLGAQRSVRPTLFQPK